MIAVFATCIACSGVNTSCLPNGLKNIRDKGIATDNTTANSSTAARIITVLFFIIIL
jgi:hypothetical protein